MYRTFLVSSALILGVSIASTASAQQAGRRQDSDNYVVVTKLVVEVIGRGGKVDEVVGYFDTDDEANAAVNKWEAEHPNDMRMAHARKIQQRVYQGKAKPQQSLPDFNAGLDWKKNNWVDIKPSESPVEKDNADSVAGKSGQLTVTIRELPEDKKKYYTTGPSTWTIEFSEDGTPVFIGQSSGKKDRTGRWSQTGKTVQIETNGMRLIGTVGENGISGKAVERDKDRPWVGTWEVTFGGQNQSVSLPGQWGKSGTLHLKISQDGTLEAWAGSGRSWRGTWKGDASNFSARPQAPAYYGQDTPPERYLEVSGGIKDGKLVLQCRELFETGGSNDWGEVTLEKE